MLTAVDTAWKGIFEGKKVAYPSSQSDYISLRVSIGLRWGTVSVALLVYLEAVGAVSILSTLFTMYPVSKVPYRYNSN